MSLSKLARIRWLLPALGLLVALAFMSRRHMGQPGGSAPTLAPEEAARYEGREAVVCGAVFEARYMPNLGGQPTFLNFGASHPEQVFTAVIWGRARGAFSAAPEVLYDGEQICVSGEIRDHRGTPQIEVDGPGAIRIGPPP